MVGYSADRPVVRPAAKRSFHAPFSRRAAVVEGVLTVTTLSVADQIERGEHMAKEKKTTFDAKTVKGPKTSIMIKGEGAEVQ